MLVLASNSPRRKYLLALGGWEFQILPFDIDERINHGESPQNYVKRIAQEKADKATSSVNRGNIVIAADTIVVDGDDILGKPDHERDAWKMLKRLRGRTHQVYTAMSVVDSTSGNTSTDLCITEVTMRSYSPAEMNAYISSGDPLDKAGAYAIQHKDFNPVDNLTGCFANVVGLPLCHLARLLRKYEIYPTNNLVANCQESLEFNCVIWNTV
jgi:septum formation protein